MINWVSVVENLPNDIFKGMDEYTKYAYLKTFIPWTYDEGYGFELRRLKEYLEA